MSLVDTSSNGKVGGRPTIQRLAVYGSVLLAALVGLALAWPAPITAADVEQPRLDRPAPTPASGVTVSQTFTAEHNGLSAVEVLAVVSPNDADPRLTVRLLSNGAEVAAQTFAHLQHNAPVRLEFPPQAQSAGQVYTLALEGDQAGGVTAWAYHLDGYAGGALSAGGAPVPGDLRFVTTYTYQWPDLLRDAAASLARLIVLSWALWLVLFVPGLALLDGLNVGEWLPSAWARWGLALGLSVSLLPLAWQWLTVFGLAWTAPALVVVYACLGLWVVGRWAWRWRRRPRPWPRPTRLDLAVAVILIFSGVARLVAVRDVAFPLWVDSPHHYLIAELLAQTGQVPASYEPLLPVSAFTYHFGFHVVAVAFHWLSDVPLVDTFVFLGQALNGLAALAVFGLAQALTGRARAGVLAAFVVGLVALFPAYYVSWGRYTQLTGLLVLAPLASVTWQLVAVARASAPPRAVSRWALVVLVAVLAAGLAFTHYRVLAFYATFALVALALGRAGGWRWVLAAGVLGGALALPWLWRLWAEWILPILRAPAQLESPAGYNSFPVAYFQSALERGWMIAAVAASLLGLWQRDRATWAVWSWVALTFAVLNVGPGSWLVNNNAWAISLFMPGAVLLGGGVDAGLSAVEAWARAPASWRRGLGLALYAIVGGAVAYAGLAGVRGQITVANPVTVLATTADRPALEWVAAHTPTDSVFLVNSWAWQYGLWAASDGGEWLWPLVGRRTTMPPVDYSYQDDWASQVQGYNERLARITQGDSPETLALLREAGVTHIFIGARGGVLKPEMFADSPHYRLLYTNGAAWVFAVVPAAGD